MATNETQETLEGFGFGVPKYGGGQYQNWKLEDGKPPMVVRIFPPMKSLATKGDWAVYFGKIWGWKGRDPSNPTKTRMRPFLSLDEKDRQTQMVTFRDAASKLIEDRNTRRKKFEDKAREKGWTGEQLKSIAEYADLLKWTFEHSVDRKWYVPCMNLQGEFGLLRITHTCMKTLRLVIKEQVNKGRDPIGMKGMWLEFTRSGKGFDTKDQVKIYTVTKNTPDGEVEVPQYHIIDAKVAKAANDALPDLAEFRDSFKISAAQIEQLVESSGDPDEVDRIMGRSGSTAPAVEEEDTTMGTPTSASKAVDDDDIQLPTMPAKAQSKASKPVDLPNPGTSAVSMSDDDFDAAFGS